ncbi:NAD(P)H-dependent oxidoreductase [Paenibacillus ehimensis]|uniref:NAD(P)H-dependent oxidoreductase n=1 Tax=Paenibacillus ehimensis TaxID=79264 RepID=A0ABT8V7A2_9BACL|nr:NAD(P)H-dependent oxidoreductase [Paenibacillus ehimensis]MDO3677324.1 NAD(P)H-dependent oxidoreductase [Paenibacillus ehimensis]MEC0208046.1 NAD(P)H-dependent oxidoreductase [Paenibacillus ehimensis]
MNHLMIYTHPRKRSFNRAILDAVTESLRQGGDEVIVRDLYGIGFQPVLGPSELLGGVGEDVVREQSYVSWADHVVFIYPLWWTGLPAMLKGYIDRVFSYGFAYKYDDGVQIGLLAGKKATLIHTQNKSAEQYEASGMGNALRLTIDEGILAYCGFEVNHHFVFDSILASTAEHRQTWLAQLSERVRKSES